MSQDNRIDQLFQQKKERVLNVYFTAGYPQLNDTCTIIKTLQQSGADLIEIGMPFSDPVADGPTIQESNQVALNNGMSLKLLFEQLKGIREEVSIPIVLMGYINPVLQFGIEAFCKACQEVGVDGLILPDLPMQEYLKEYKGLFDQYGLHNIFLITPQTSDDRICEIDSNSKGFIYMVSSASTTGAKTDISQSQIDYFERVKQMQLQNPTLIGFGISNQATFRQACQYASGAIIGSAFIKVLSQAQNLEHDISGFIQEVISQ
ncbi:tryptophan synthase subunit alpha [Rapidithrix thailandica]|uniref:Tryptophan synthase alpha chain n=1 Tax=Rapidithrix thailandica TaxID=413964 RepID=A0AAW9SHV8_9BACT